MLALIAGGRGGDSAPPVYSTVPWSPEIARRGQLPGQVWRAMKDLLALVDRYGLGDAFARMPEVTLLTTAVEMGGVPDLIRAMGLVAARRVLLDLELLPRPG